MNLSCVCNSKLSWGMVCLCILSAGSRTILGSPSFMGLGDLTGGGLESIALGVSSDGSVIVGWSSFESGPVAFIWDQANSMRNLRDVLVNDHGLDLTGWHLAVAFDISPDGQTIVGYGINPDGLTEAWIAEIPEPATVSLLALGAAAMLRRRRC